jgi:signal transduction histidine kinase
MTAPDAAFPPRREVLNGDEPLGSVFYIFSLVLVLSGALVLLFVRPTQGPGPSFGELAFWVVLILIMNLAPFNVGDLSFTLDTPLLLTVALLYPPEVASLVAFVGSMDFREVRRQVGPLRALFNRSQIALSVLLAALVFRFFTGGDLNPWTWAVLGTGAAVLSFHVVNGVTVAIRTALRSRTPLTSALSALTVGPTPVFLATYFGYGVLALVLAHLFIEVGPWAVALFLIPLIVGHQMLVRGDALLRLTKELRHRERLLERLFDRIIEERRDERLRIATGLHDDVLQSLIRIGQLGSFMRKALPKEGSVADDARELELLSRDTVESLRHVLSDLQRSPIGRGGLVPSLRTLAQDLQLDWRTRISVRVDEDMSLSPEVQIAAYQAAREAIMNSLKHAGATAIKVTLKEKSGDLIVLVEDDGHGFQPKTVDESQRFGLGLMRTRVELAGGFVEVHSQEEEGTRVTVSLPASSVAQGTGSETA